MPYGWREAAPWLLGEAGWLHRVLRGSDQHPMMGDRPIHGDRRGLSFLAVGVQSDEGLVDPKGRSSSKDHSRDSRGLSHSPRGSSSSRGSPGLLTGVFSVGVSILPALVTSGGDVVMLVGRLGTCVLPDFFRH